MLLYKTCTEWCFWALVPCPWFNWPIFYCKCLKHYYWYRLNKHTYTCNSLRCCFFVESSPGDAHDFRTVTTVFIQHGGNVSNASDPSKRLTGSESVRWWSDWFIAAHLWQNCVPGACAQWTASHRSFGLNARQGSINSPHIHPCSLALYASTLTVG